MSPLVAGRVSSRYPPRIRTRAVCRCQWEAVIATPLRSLEAGALSHHRLASERATAHVFRCERGRGSLCRRTCRRDPGTAGGHRRSRTQQNTRLKQSGYVETLCTASIPLQRECLYRIRLIAPEERPHRYVVWRGTACTQQNSFWDIGLYLALRRPRGGGLPSGGYARSYAHREPSHYTLWADRAL